MANNGQTMLVAEPHFYGEPNPKGVSAEEYIAKFRNLKVSGNWSDAQTLAIVKNTLHGKASAWYSALFFDSEDDPTYMTTFEAFTIAFREAFFTTHVETDYAFNVQNMHQLPNETLPEFAHRLAASFHDQAQLVKKMPLDHPNFQAAMTAHNAEMTRVAADITEGPTDPHMGQIAFATNVLLQRAIDTAVKLNFSMTASKLLVDGLTNPTYKQIVRTKRAEGLSMRELITLINKLHRDAKKPSASNAPTKPNAVNAVDTDNEDVEEVEVNAVKGKKKGKGKTTKGKKKTNAVTTAPVSSVPTGNPANLPRTPCRDCNEYHWHRDCPKYKAYLAEKQRTSAQQSAPVQGPTPGFFAAAPTVPQWSENSNAGLC
jgi:hypothetical protein